MSGLGGGGGSSISASTPGAILWLKCFVPGVWDIIVNEWTGAPSGGVSQIVAGTGITISPSGGTGVVTISTTGSGANITPDTHPGTPTDWDDEFEFGTTIDTAGARFAGANPWSILNQPASSTLTVQQGGLTLFSPSQSSTALLLVGQAAPSGACTFRAKQAGFVSGSNNNYNDSGIAFYNSGNGRLVSIAVQMQSAGTQLELLVFHWDSVTSFNSAPYQIQLDSPPNAIGYSGDVYLSLRTDGTTLYYGFCYGGYASTYQEVSYNELITTFLGAITHVGLHCNNDTSGNATWATYDWFRRIA